MRLQSLQHLLFLGAVTFALSGCRGCQPRVTQIEPAKLSLDATRLDFPATYVGSTATQALQVLNSGRASAPVELHTAEPFSTGTATPLVAGGTTEDVSVAFAPTSAGVVTGTLTVGELLVELHGEGLAIPECTAADPCETSTFDVDAGACAVEALADDTPCASVCVTGRCVSGQCRGAAVACDDENPCTVDACSASGCVHLERECPVVDRCTASYCDPAVGCATSPLPDGTLCGDQSCRRADICLAGLCGSRPRPNADEECAAVDLVADGDSTCVLTRTGKVRCWGEGFANGFQNLISSPAELPFSGRATTLTMAEGAAVVSLEAGGAQFFSRGVVLPPFDAGAGLQLLAFETNAQDSCWLEPSGAVECLAAGRVCDAGMRQLTASGNDWFHAVREDGGVAAWVGGTANVTEIPLDSPARAVRGGQPFSCAMGDDGVSCWQNGRSTPPQRLAAGISDVALSHSGRWPTLVAVGLHPDGGVSGCDDPGDGGGLMCHPRFDAGVSPFVRAAVGFSHECYLSASGDVACAGDNRHAQLGDLSAAPPGPHRVSATGVFDGGSQCRWVPDWQDGNAGLLTQNCDGCWLFADAGVSCEGDNQCGRHGTGDTLPVYSRTPVAGLGPVRKVALTNRSGCALEYSGRIQCWGCSVPGAPPVAPATPVAGLLPFARDLVCGGAHCCSLAGSNVVNCWGTNRLNELGREGVWNAAVSVPLPGRVEQLAALGATTCARLSSGEVWCWGDNGQGQLGQTPLLFSDLPVWVR